MLRIPAVLAACIAVLLVASACTDDKPEPNFSSVSTSPTPTTSATPTPSSSISVPATGPNVNPGEVAPTEPAQASVNSAEGAQAFASYYVRMLDWTFATANSAILAPFYAAMCTTCQSREDYLDQLFADGATLSGGRLTLLQAEAVANDGRLGATSAVSTAVSVAGASVVASNGATTSSLPPESFISLTTWLTWDGGRWQIVEERYA